MKSTNMWILIITLFTIGLLMTSPLTAQEVHTTGETVEKEEPAVVPEPVPEPVYPKKRVLSIGVLGGYSMDIHNATDLKLPNIPSCCPGYDGGSGGGFVGGLSIDFPLTDDLELVNRLTYHSTAVDMVTSEPITVRVDDQPVASSIEHTLSTTTTFIGFEPAIAFRIVGDLSIMGGFRIAALTGMTYDQKSVLDPSIPYDFEGGSGVRNESSGDVTTTSSANFGILIGARYVLGLNTNRTLMLIPEVQYAPILTSFVDTQSWSISSFRFMLGLSYAITTQDKESTPLKP